MTTKPNDRTRSRSRAKLIESRRSLREQVGGTKNIMTAPERPGFTRRWVNIPLHQHGPDTRRVEHLKSLGWNIVTDQTIVGNSDNVTERNKTLEGGALMYVGENVNAVLMEIPTEHYEADKWLKEEALLETEKEIMNKPNQPGQYGEIKLGNLTEG